MTRPMTAAALITLLTACAHTTSVPSNDGAFGWLTGCWQSTNGATREIWTESFEGLLFGHSVTVRDGRVVFFEDLRITPTQNGVDFSASPGGATPTVFEMIDQGTSMARFANPEHDYPQIITYLREDQRLTATTSLIDGAQSRVFSFTACK